MDKPDHRHALAMMMVVTHGHLFPTMTPYWRYRTFRRLLTTHGAEDAMTA